MVDRVMETATVVLSSDPRSGEARLGLADGSGAVGWGALAEDARAAADRLGGRRVPLAATTLPSCFDPALERALEQATLDLLARRAGCPLAALLAGVSATARARVAAHVRVADPAGVRAAMARGLSRFEVALGSGSLAEEDYRLTRLRARAGRDAEVGLDADAAGWDAGETRRGLERLASHRPAWVISRAGGALAPASVTLLVDATRPDREPPAAGVGVVVRPAATGLARGRRLLVRARDAGLAAFVATAARGAVGLLGALHLAASVPGTGLLVRAPLEALKDALVDAGDLVVSEAPGVGAVS